MRAEKPEKPVWNGSVGRSPISSQGSRSSRAPMPVSESWGPFQPPSGLLPLVRAEEPHQLVQMESDKHTPMPAQEDAQGGSDSSLTRSKHSHWCTSRQHRGEIKSCAGFKRHEKEDEEYYVFLPLGPIVPGPQGSPKCALCDELHPDDAHLEEHNVLMYKEKKAPIRKSRRQTLRSCWNRMVYLVQPSRS